MAFRAIVPLKNDAPFQLSNQSINQSKAKVGAVFPFSYLNHSSGKYDERKQETQQNIFA